MENRKVRQPPQGLQPRGRALWREVVASYTLRPDEIELLRSLCNAVDQIHRVKLRMKAEHVTSTGSSGQLTGHPADEDYKDMEIDYESEQFVRSNNGTDHAGQR